MKRWGLVVAALLLPATMAMAAFVAALNTNLLSSITSPAISSSVNVSGYDVALVQVIGTYQGSILPEISGDNGTTFTNISCYTATAVATNIINWGITDVYRCNVAGATHFRANVSALRSGSLSVWLSAVVSGVAN